MKVFENMFFLFWYVSDMICCYDLFMAWFCCYDFDMVSVMILIWFQLWFLMWVKLVIWSQPIGTISKKYSKIVSKPYQNRIKIKSKPNQNQIKTTKTCKKSTKNLSLGCLCFFFWSQLTGTTSKPYQNHIKIVSKSYQNHIKIIPKPYRNHKNTWKLDQKPVPGLFLFLCLKPTHWNHIKTVSKSYQNRNKTHIEIITPSSKHIKFISSNRIQNHIKIVKNIFPEFSILEGFRAYKD